MQRKRFADGACKHPHFRQEISAMKRKALFVGIAQYTRGIPALSCARNDANALLECRLVGAQDREDWIRRGQAGISLQELTI